MQRNNIPSPEKEKRGSLPPGQPKTDPPIDPDKEKRDPLPPSKPDVYPEVPDQPSSPSAPEFHQKE
jgi:hypothetical protein